MSNRRDGDPLEWVEHYTAMGHLGAGITEVGASRPFSDLFNP